MSEVVAYRLILTAAILLFAGGAVLASRLTKRPIRQWADITAITMLIMPR